MPIKSEEGLYAVHPAIAYARSVLDNLPSRTGRSIDEWVQLVQKDGPEGEKEGREWLKKEYKLGGTTASMIVQQAAGKGAENTDPDAYLRAAAGYVEAIYSGAKAALRPIHDALIKSGRCLGEDVRICPCKTIVPFYRKHVFAEIKPSTRTRIDLGLALKGLDQPIPERLIDTGGLARGDRITHRIALTSSAEIDQEVQDWLKIAYDLDG